ncbi:MULTISPECIES: RNA polymerase sigma factor [unclassified Microbacterium]|uniref:RNA polymerase sigma factor n=1 Tax=unclassified Microbacterium TaxID=2609290 RepID=UPI000C2C9FD9|nr:MULTISPECIES: RNA polymerase sigma factor [unclassified Microbacterium]
MTDQNAAVPARREVLEALLTAEPLRLRRRSISLGVHPDDADDVAQTIALRAWRSVDTVASSEPKSLCAWIDVIARTTAADLFRLRSRRPEEQLSVSLSAAHDVLSAVDDRVRLRQAVDAIHDLPDTLRDPFVLSVMEGRSAAETAAMLGINPSAVRQRLTRARSMLRAELRTEGGESGV